MAKSKSTFESVSRAKTKSKFKITVYRVVLVFSAFALKSQKFASFCGVPSLRFSSFILKI